MPQAGPVMKVPCSTTWMPSSTFVMATRSRRLRAEAGRNAPSYTISRVAWYESAKPIGWPISS